MGIQCYELFRVMAHKNHAFFFSSGDIRKFLKFTLGEQYRVRASASSFVDLLRTTDLTKCLIDVMSR